MTTREARKTDARITDARITIAASVAAGFVILVVVLNVSVVLLALKARIGGTAATAAAVVAATAVLLGAAYVSARESTAAATGVTALVIAGTVLSLAGMVGALALEEAPTSHPAQPALGPPDLVVTAGPGFRFEPKQLWARPGRHVVEFVNADTIPHTLNIDDVPGFHLLVNAQGDRVRAVADLPQPTTYAYYCDLPGHRQAGMEGTINVTGPPA